MWRYFVLKVTVRRPDWRVFIESFTLRDINKIIVSSVLAADWAHPALWCLSGVAHFLWWQMQKEQVKQGWHWRRWQTPKHTSIRRGLVVHAILRTTSMTYSTCLYPSQTWMRSATSVLFGSCCLYSHLQDRTEITLACEIQNEHWLGKEGLLDYNNLCHTLVLSMLSRGVEFAPIHSWQWCRSTCQLPTNMHNHIIR